MIYIGFVLDYLLNLMTPLNTYFVIYNIEKNKLIEVIFIGCILDFIYQKYLYNLIILLILYYLSKKIKINKKYNIYKNIIIFLIYFHLTYFIFGYNIEKYLISLLISLTTYLLYIFIIKLIFHTYN